MIILYFVANIYLEVIPCVSFCLWVTSFKMEVPSSIHLPEKFMTSFFFIGEQFSKLYVYIIYSLLVEHLGYIIS